MARLAFTLAYLNRFSEAQFEPGKHQSLAARTLHFCVRQQRVGGVAVGGVGGVAWRRPQRNVCAR
jgi:hypothetical protein